MFFVGHGGCKVVEDADADDDGDDDDDDDDDEDEDEDVGDENHDEHDEGGDDDNDDDDTDAGGGFNVNWFWRPMRWNTVKREIFWALKCYHPMSQCLATSAHNKIATKRTPNFHQTLNTKPPPVVLYQLQNQGFT